MTNEEKILKILDEIKFEVEYVKEDVRMLKEEMNLQNKGNSVGLRRAINQLMNDIPLTKEEDENLAAISAEINKRRAACDL